jgi:hypothetical protein
MLHLKKFNEINKDEYYIQIPSNEWQKLIGFDDNGVYGSNIEGFTHKEKMELAEFWSNVTHFGQYGMMRWDGYDRFTGKNNIDYIHLTIDVEYGVYYITKCKDEWYGIFYRPNKSTQFNPTKQFKCDQLDGLKLFIQDVILNRF